MITNNDNTALTSARHEFFIAKGSVFLDFAIHKAVNAALRLREMFNSLTRKRKFHYVTGVETVWKKG